MESTRKAMEKEGTVSESTEETESMNRNPSKDLKKLRGKGRSFQANKNEQ